jgi:hypothetical protein
MGKWVIALLATGVALVAASARAQTGQVLLGPTVYSSRNLPANAITRFTVGCPRGYFAVSGGVSSPGPGSTLLSVRPVGLRAYTFRFGNPVTKDSTRVTVLVACRTIRRGPVLIVKPVKTRLVVRPGQIKSGALACPANTTPAGSAIDLDPGRSRSIDSFAGVALSVRTSTATLRAFQFRIANAGARAQEVVVQGTCATVLFASAAERASLNTRISTYTDAISPGRHRLRHRCLGGWTALGTGYSLGSGAVRIEGAAAFAADGRWWVRNTSSAPLRAELQLVCGRLT